MLLTLALMTGSLTMPLPKALLEAAPLLLFDLSNTARTGNVTHIYIQSNGLNSTCNLYQLSQASSQGQLFPASFLQQNAIYAGQETVNGIAFIYITDKWAVIIGNTIVSFYFDKMAIGFALMKSAKGAKHQWLHGFTTCTEGCIR